MLLPDSHLRVELLNYERVIHQVFVALSLHFIVLKALGQEEDALEGENLLASIAEVVATHLDLVFKLGPVFGVEWRLSVEKLEQDNTDGPYVSLVGVVCLLHDLWGHVKWRAADGFVDLF